MLRPFPIEMRPQPIKVRPPRSAQPIKVRPPKSATGRLSVRLTESDESKGAVSEPAEFVASGEVLLSMRAADCITILKEGKK